MNWAALGVIVEGIVAVAVLITLLVLILEVRSNTKALRAQAHESMVSGYMASIGMITDHAPIMSKGFAATYEEFLTFPDEDKLTYFSVLFASFKHFEQMHSQQERGLMDAEEWDAWSGHIRMQLHHSGVNWWWEKRRTSFKQSFRTFIDASKPPEALIPGYGGSSNSVQNPSEN